MTDEQVIKALEWLIFNFQKQDNPKDDSDRICNCINLYCQNAVDLIKQQQAEIEHFRDLTKKIKSEAYKEFAERLKEKGTPVTGGKGFEGVYVMCSNLAIDNLVKELKEGK